MPTFSIYTSSSSSQLLFLLLLAVATTLLTTPTTAFAITRGGGRAPSLPDDNRSPNDDDDLPWSVQPLPDPQSATRLILLHITDVYTLDNLASFQRLLQETRAQAGPGTTVLSVLTGDFLAPYLLSAVDRGAGMMRALSAIPIDILTWGNHEADIDHRTVCRHVQNFATESGGAGVWLNSNMLDHAAMEYQKDYHVVELQSGDGSHTRRVGLCAVLSDAEGLYAHFKAPGAFNVSV